MDTFSWTFPGGRRRVVAIGATAGNVVSNQSPGAGKRWLILRGLIVLVTDVTVAARYVDLMLTDGTNIVSYIAQSDVQAASGTKRVSFGEVRQYVGAGAPYNHVGIQPILLESADQFRISITAGVAGDSYTGYLVVLELEI